MVFKCLVFNRKLISLAAHQRNDKEVLFEELYGLWKSNGLGTLRFLKDQLKPIEDLLSKISFIQCNLK